MILTNDYESSKDLYTLKACHKDGDEIEETFAKTFGFACFRKYNATSSETKAVLKAVGNSNYPATRHYKCITVAFSGHGTAKDAVVANDGKNVDIYEHFLGPLQKGQLNNVPKLFFFDACRGSLDMKRLRWQKSPGPEEGGYVLAYATMDGYLAYAGRGQSKWMPKVAQKLRDLPQNGAKTVQDVVGKVIKEFRENPDLKYQCPEIIDTYGPVYLSEIANIHGESLHGK